MIKEYRRPLQPGDLGRHCGGRGKEILMLYPTNQRAHQFNSIQSVPVSFDLWDTALTFLSPGRRNDVTDHLAVKWELTATLHCMYDLLKKGSPLSTI